MKTEEMFIQLVNLYETHRTEGGTLSPHEFLEFWEAAQRHSEGWDEAQDAKWKIAEQAMKQQRDGEALDALFASPHPSLKVRHETVRPEGEAEDQARHDRTAKTANFCQQCGKSKPQEYGHIIYGAYYDQLIRPATTLAPPEPITDHQESVSDSLPPCQKCGLVKNGPYIECGDCKRVLCEDCYTGPPPVVCQDCKGKRP